MTPQELTTLEGLLKLQFQSLEQRIDQRFQEFEVRQDKRFQEFEVRQDQRFHDFEQRADQKFEAHRLDTQRYMGVLTEEFQSRVSLVAESVEMLDEKMERRFAEAESTRSADYNFLRNLCANNAKAITKLDTKLTQLHAKLSAEIAGVDAKLSAKIDALHENFSHVHRRLADHDVIVATLSR